MREKAKKEKREVEKGEGQCLTDTALRGGTLLYNFLRGNNQ